VLHTTRKQFKIVEQESFLAKSTIEYGNYESSLYDESNDFIPDLAIPGAFYIEKPNKSIEKFMINLDHPLSIPEGLLFHDNMYTRVDLETGMLYFYENHLKDHEHEILSRMQLRSYFHETLDFGKDANDNRLH
jgi:hypothetical protein